MVTASHVRRSFASVGVALLLVLLGTPVMHASAKKYVQNGNKAFFKLDYEGAAKKYLEAEKKMKKGDREFAIAMLNIAAAYWKLGNYPKAAEYLDKASESIWGPKSGWQSLNLGFGTGVLTNESKRQWIGTDNERLFVRLYAALSPMQMGNYDDALIGFKMCEKISENYPIARYFHGYTASLVPEERENAAVHLKAAALAATSLKPLAKGAVVGNPFADLRLAYLSMAGGDAAEAESRWAIASKQLDGNPVLDQKADVLRNGTNVVLLVERGWAPVNAKDKTKSFPLAKVMIDGKPAGSAVFFDYSGQHDKIGTADAFKAAGAALATEYGKAAAKNVAASVVPGGGIVAGLFMGGKRDKSVATWDKIPPVFFLYETRLAAGSHQVTLQLWDANGKKKGAETTRTLTVRPNQPVIMTVPICLKK